MLSRAEAVSSPQALPLALQRLRQVAPHGGEPIQTHRGCRAHRLDAGCTGRPMMVGRRLLTSLLDRGAIARAGRR